MSRYRRFVSDNFNAAWFPSLNLQRPENSNHILHHHTRKREYKPSRRMRVHSIRGHHPVLRTQRPPCGSMVGSHNDGYVRLRRPGATLYWRNPIRTWRCACAPRARASSSSMANRVIPARFHVPDDHLAKTTARGISVAANTEDHLDTTGSLILLAIRRASWQSEASVIRCPLQRT